ncbi:hypothetical protein B0H67DRAFT_57445 [Lasiosphaeris hirsuta]|uniref:Uncharacterized protein n=1 Tax=Lasiosphaeris hirsuta TaxID=260670 RepID=A0AA40BB47_9PEZI|nr:hypothetical protein B0H67DRAFT_57445 [Lasiosphaeris hirsuta]
MVTSKTFGLLALACLAIASPFPAEVLDVEEPTVTVTVTTTATASVTLAPSSVGDLTVQRTFTVTSWAKTTTLVSLLNCTRTVLAAGSTARAPPVPIPTPARPSAIFRRQNSTSAAIPPPTIPVPGRPRRTRTSWAITTAIPTGELRRTRYECAATLTYLYTVDKTTTQVLTITAYPNIVTATSTINCFPPGRGSPPSRLPPPTPVPSTTAVALSSAAKRQESSSVAPVTPPAVVPTAAPYGNSTITVHLTSTAYSFVTTTDSNTTTAAIWACSPLSAPAAPGRTTLPPPVIPPVSTSVATLPPPATPPPPASLPPPPPTPPAAVP